MSKTRRCLWVDPEWELGVCYHDKEWGVPVTDDRLLFEMLVLESFQAGLSWAIILKKREGFREAFDQFDPDMIANYSNDKINQLLVDPRIVRSEAKIRATIGNAKVFLAIQKEFGSFSNYLWKFTDDQVMMSENFSVTSTALSDEVSADLKKRGMKFMGTVTTYAYLQAVGVVNNHEPYCFRRAEVLQTRL